MSRLWRIWCKALGEKAFPSKRDADLVALTRTILILIQIITCFFIMINVVRHW